MGSAVPTVPAHLHSRSGDVYLASSFPLRPSYSGPTQAWGHLGRDVLTTAEIGTSAQAFIYIAFVPAAVCSAAFLGSRQKRSGTSKSCGNWKVGCVCSSWKQVVPKLRVGLELGNDCDCRAGVRTPRVQLSYPPCGTVAGDLLRMKWARRGKHGGVEVTAVCFGL